MRWLVSILTLVVGLIVGYFFGNQSNSMSSEIKREVYVDTVTYEIPIPVDSVIIRTDVVKLPITDVICTDIQNPLQITDTIPMVTCVERQDSVYVQVPISQYTFEEDSVYKLKVSGFRVSLDSISVYRQKEMIYLRERQKHWHIGLSVGVGFSPKGVLPTVGVSLTYPILSF